MPSLTPHATQVQSFQGVITVSSNALGFMRIHYTPFTGSILAFNDATHTDLVLGAGTSILNLNVSLSYYTYLKVVSAGLILTSNANF